MDQLYMDLGLWKMFYLKADSPLYVWPDVWPDLQVYESVVIQDTECPYWDQVSLNNINLFKGH